MKRSLYLGQDVQVGGEGLDQVLDPLQVVGLSRLGLGVLQQQALELAHVHLRERFH